MKKYFLLLVWVVSGLECSSYRCSSEYLGEDICILHQNSTYYINPCPEAKYCPPLEVGVRSYCVSHTTPIAYAWPGESCVNAPCQYGSCDGQYCQGASHNETCTLNGECNPGLRCHKSYCKALLPKGKSGCESDFDCENDSGCDKGKCVRYFSKREAEEVECNNNRTNICESGACYKGYCLGYLKNDNPLPALCNTTEDCTSSMYDMPVYPIKFYQDCECGYNKEANAYCSLFVGDLHMKNYLSLLKKWLSSLHAKKCNTERRYSLECIKDHWKPQHYEEIHYAKLLVDLYPKLQNNEPCVKKVYTAQFYKEEEDSALVLGVASLLIYLI